MIQVTDKAAQYLDIMASRHDIPEGKTLRLMQNGQGMGFAIDVPKQADRTVEYDGKIVLCMAKEFEEMLGSRTLQLRKTERGPELVFH